MSTKIKIIYTIWDTSGYSLTSQRLVQLMPEEEKNYNHACKTFWKLALYPSLKKLLDEVKADIESDEKNRREKIGNINEFSVMVDFMEHPEKSKIREEEARITLTDLFLQSHEDYFFVQDYVENSWIKYKDGDLEELSLEVAAELGYLDYEGLEEGVGLDNPQYLQWLSQQKKEESFDRRKYRYE